MKTLLIIIPARKGSVRVPNKNLRPIGNGETLVSIALKTAQTAATYIPAKCNIWLSTDYAWVDIVRGTESAGLNVRDFLLVARPPHLCTPEATSEQVVSHCLDIYEQESGMAPDDVMLLQPTSPLRTVADVCLAYKQHIETGAMRTFSFDGYSASSRVNGAIYITKPGCHEYSGKWARRYGMPPSRSLDIDTEEDFAKADEILKGLK